MALSKESPTVRVGIFTRRKFQFTLKGAFRNCNNHQLISEGTYTASFENDAILIDGRFYNSFHLIPENPNCSFVLHDVTIGVGFHWERDEDQVFRGALKILANENLLSAINVLPVDDYLSSVISSEMSATSSLELLKAHAVISRSWLLAQIEKNKQVSELADNYESTFITDNEIVKWYDREDHAHFDVCADDHCQRYQGMSKVTTPLVHQAVSETGGLVLTSDNSICDARFSKCCGGVTELFENCWEPIKHTYLKAFADKKDTSLPVLTDHANAETWIKASPDVFCNTTDATILKPVLNNFDQETQQFFRWSVTYTQKALSELVRTKTGIDFGTITDLTPLERGTSGRIIRLKIVGSLKTMIIGKELEIRKALSESHLYSSAFMVTKDVELNKFIIEGAGWGHGVGLCQIGAAVMGAKGYTYNQILMHYFRGAKIEKRY